MATGGLYGYSAEGALIASPGAESSGLYGNSTSFGGTYFEWFIFKESATQPATPTGGSWDFVTNVGTPPTGWSTSPPSNPSNYVWISIAIVNSRDPNAYTWSTPGRWYLSGLPVLSGSSDPTGGVDSQYYIQISTIPQTIWFKEFGTWIKLSGSNIYVDLINSQTIGGTKTFSSTIQGSISGTSANVTGTVAIANGGTGATTASGARTNLGLGTAAVLDAGVANGVATLDSGGTVPLSQIPASLQGGVSYQGAWNASTNSPTLTSSVGTKGYYYVVSVAGSTNLNGVTDWNVGDWAIFNGTVWQKIDNTDAVTSVNGYTGTVVLNAADVGALSTLTSTDGSVTITSPNSVTRDLSVAVAGSTTNVLCLVRNTTGATLTKGTVVYISGAIGQNPTVSKALATSDATSAQTLGMMTADLANNSNGYVTVIGLITDIDTSAYTNGQQLYLSGTTAGAVTGTKPYAPIHLVYVAVVEHAHPTQGKLFVKVQNGYELDEIHNVSAQTPSNGQTIVYNSSTQLWENSNAPIITGSTIDNTTIGATTPSTGVFTTLTATGQTSLGGVAGAESVRAVVPSTTGGNYWQFAGSASNMRVDYVGTSTNIGSYFVAKGTGFHSFTTAGSITIEQMRVAHTTSAVNYVQVTGGATGSAAQISAQGSDSTIALQYNSKSATGQHIFTAASLNAFRILPVASAVNYSTVSNSATAFSPIFSVAGTDTNISQVFQPKGTGAIDLAAGSSGVNISNGGTVTAITGTTASSYSTIPTITISAPTTAGGVQATASAAMQAQSNPTINVAGTGYAVNDTLTLVGGTFSQAAVYTIASISGSGVATTTLTTAGTYTALPTAPVATTSSGAGTGCTLTPSWGVKTSGHVITNAGSGYVEQPTITFSSGGAAAYATVGSGTVVKSIGSTLSFNMPQGEVLRLTDNAATSINYLQLLTGSVVGMYAQGASANVGLSFVSKGTSGITFATSTTSANQQFQISHTASAVNYVQVTGAATGGVPNISAQGSDSAIGLTLQAKSASILFLTRASQNRSFNIADTNSPVNYLQVQGSTTGLGLQFSAQGADTNISQVFQSKGTGAIDLAAGSSGVNISNGGTVTALTVTASGSAYTSIPTPAITAPTTSGGVQAVATATALALNRTIISGGTGYTVNDVVTVVGGTFTTAAQFTVSAVSGGVVTTLAALQGGTYSVLPTGTLSTTGGTGTGLTLTIDTWGVRGLTITNAGSGYVEQPTVTFSGGGGSGATAFATIGLATSFKSLSDLTINLPSGPVLSLTDSSLPSTGAYLNLSNGSTSNAIQRSVGSNTNIGIYWLTKGTGVHSFNTANSTTTQQFVVTHTASAVNYIQVTGAATANPPVLSAQGSDSTIAMLYQAKGGQDHRFFSNSGSAEQFRVLHTTGTIANQTYVTGSVAGASPIFGVRGSDTNIDLTLTPKGTGVVQFGTLTATADTAISGYITIRDAGGTLRKLAVIT